MLHFNNLDLYDQYHDEVRHTKFITKKPLSSHVVRTRVCVHSSCILPFPAFSFLRTWSLLYDKTFKEATPGTNAKKITQRCVSRGYVFRADRTKNTIQTDAWAFVYVERRPMKRKK
jgi:hypothetical protein